MNKIYRNKYEMFNKMEQAIEETGKETRIYHATPQFVCPKCGHVLIWGGDQDMEMYNYEDRVVNGIVSNYSCSNEKCDIYVEVYDSCEM